MTSKKKAAKVGTGAFAVGKAAKSNPYIKRFIDDDELRGSLVTAFGSVRKAYQRMSNGKAPAISLMEDRKVKRELKDAASSLREAANSLKKAKKRRRPGRALLIAVAGTAVALAASEGLRKKALDAVFGAEEEFEYTSTTTPEPPSKPESKPASKPAKESKSGKS